MADTEARRPRALVTDAEVLAFIRESTRDRGFPPTVREITRGVGLRATSALYVRLLRMQVKGLVTWQEGTARSIRVLEEA